MFHFFVARKVRNAFAALNAGNLQPILDSFDERRHHHVLHGQHPLAGTRDSLEPTRRWYDRLRALFPDLRFELGEVVVAGWPWRTTVMVSWTDHFTVGGRPTSNQGVHVLTLRWGRVVALEVHCDTQKLAAVCAAKAAAGLPAAAAAPITA